MSFSTGASIMKEACMSNTHQKPGSGCIGNETYDQLIVAYPIAELRSKRPAARTHSKKQIQQIAASITAFGWTNPILIDEQKYVLAGLGRLAAAKHLGLAEVPTLQISHLNEAQKRAYIIADNRLAELAGWDQNILALEFEALSNVDINFDLTITGFETPEIDILLSQQDNDSDTAETEEETLDVPQKPVSKVGDLWLLGHHRLYCGNALEEASYQTLMEGRTAELVITDPPYNVPIKGHVSGLGSVEHDEFVMATGEMTPDVFRSFLQTSLTLMAQHSVSGSLHYIFMDWRHIADLVEVGTGIYYEFKNLCVWTKTNPGMGSLYRSGHELVALFKSGTGKHINNVELGRHGRNRSNVWPYAGATSFGGDRNETLAMHPTVKPVAMISDAILDASNRGGIILDPFGGSGTILLAAEHTGRQAYMMELDPRYVDVAIGRYEAKCEVEAIHAVTGKSFSAIKSERLPLTVEV